MTSYNIDPRIAAWLEIVDGTREVNGKPMAVCNDQKLLARHVRQCFEKQDIYTDGELLDRYLRMVKYLPIEKLFEWEIFCTALHLCTFWRETGLPRWPELFLLVGRGAGKDMFIAYEGLCLISPYCGIPAYDVDVCANSEEQALRPVRDVVGALDAYSMRAPQNRRKMEKHFDWSREIVTGRRTGSVMRGRTSNPKSKDGMRSGLVVFNEIHQYTNYSIIKVFVTGLGKKPHPRRLYATTNGDVREGPLDDLLLKSEQILAGAIDDNGMLPFICRLDDKAEANNPDLWVKANPSLPYMPALRSEIIKEFEDWQQNPLANADFMTKRMNRPQMDAAIAVTSWENIISSKQDIPDLRGRSCVAGIDYASISDWASANVHFLIDGKRYDIGHSWLCSRSRDLSRITAPWREWADAGLLTVVDDVEINPELLTDWLKARGQEYSIQGLGVDNYRYALLANALRQSGFDANDRKNVRMVSPSDIYKVQPIVESAFVNQSFVWGDNPVLRWATNNTKLMRAKGRGGVDTGNCYYAKIEGKSRKTDPFMAVVHSMVLESLLETTGSTYVDLPVIIG